MGEKKPPKKYTVIRIYKWQHDSLLSILENEGEIEGFDGKLINVLTFLIRLYNIYEAYRERTGAKNLREFAKILDEFLPENPRYRIFRAFNQFQEELMMAQLPQEVIEEITEFIIAKLEKKPIDSVPSPETPYP